MPRYTFGPFELDLEGRLLRRDGEPIPMTGKMLDTLVVLVENRGRLVDKDELLSRVWAGSVVEEANLTQAIFTVRKILGDSPRDHRYIATVAGRGYQFVAPVTESTASTEAGAAEFERSRKELRSWWRRDRLLQVGAGTLMALLAAAIVLWIVRRPTREYVQSHVYRFTSFPGVEAMPAFSPDGKQLAYVRAERDAFNPAYWEEHMGGQASIYVKLIEAGTELRLTRYPGADSYPAWSPDGQYVAFYRYAPGASGCYIVSALGGHERQLTRDETEVTGIAWLPDGRRLAIAHYAERSKPEASPLVEVSLSTGEQRALTSPPRGSLGDDCPAVSPDGKTLAFLRTKDQRDFEACFQALDTKTTRCRALDSTRTLGLAWTTGDEIVVSGIRAGGRCLWRYHVNGGAPVALTSGDEDAWMPAVSRQGDQLAYVLSRTNANLWQLDVDHLAGRSAAAQRIVSSSRLQADPALSPDGRKIAYLSNRSGSWEIWVMNVETQASMQLTHFRGPPAGSPSWSPDGLQIAFDALEGAHPDIFVVPADGGTPRRITAIPGENAVPSWSQDGKFVYFASNRNGKFQIWKVLGETGETPLHPAIQVTQGGGFRAFESVDGKYLYYAKGRGKRGLWRRSLSNTSASKEELILESLQDWGWWALGPGAVYFFEAHSFKPRVRLKALNLTDGRTRELYTLASPVPTATTVMALSRDGKHLAYAQIDSVEGDIMLMERFQ
jgi:Tol biopolymer transport system component/DNA-binding winged helix-turn-helix (wHTH) protein